MKKLVTMFIFLSLSGILFALFNQWPIFTIASGVINPSLVEVGDIDSDGDPDVAITAYSGDKVLWCENDQLNWTSHTIDNFLDGAVGLRIADIDADNDSDVVAAGGYANTVVWYENILPDTNWPKQTIDGNLPGAHYITISDIDGDGDKDILANGWLSSQIVWYQNNLPSPWNKIIIDSSLSNCRNLEAADIDVDGDKDLVATSQNAHQIVLYTNNLPNSNWDKDTIDTSLPGAWGLRIADIDGDDSLDIIATGYDGDVVVWYKNENAGQNWTKSIIDDSIDGARCLYTVDMDKDLNMDIIVTGSEENTVMLYKNVGSNSVTWMKDTIDTELNGSNYLVAADINLDGYDDAIVTAWNANQVVWYQNPIVAINPNNQSISHDYILYQNYPNPFNPSTTIEFDLSKTSEVSLKVFNILGEEVATLLSASLLSGSHTVEWNAGNLASGVYLYRLEAEGFVETRKMILMK